MSEIESVTDWDTSNIESVLDWAKDLNSSIADWEPFSSERPQSGTTLYNLESDVKFTCNANYKIYKPGVKQYNAHDIVIRH